MGNINVTILRNRIIRSNILAVLRNTIIRRNIIVITILRNSIIKCKIVTWVWGISIGSMMERGAFRVGTGISAKLVVTGCTV